MVDDHYGTDVLANGWRGHGRSESASVPAERGLVIEVQADGFCGAVTQADAATVELEDRFGMRRRFPLGPGFLLDGSHVVLVAHRPAASRQPQRTASGSFAAPQQCLSNPNGN